MRLMDSPPTLVSDPVDLPAHGGRRPRQRLPWTPIALIALLLLGVCLALAARGRPGPSLVEKAKVRRGTITSTISSTGRVEARQEVEIKCRASGEVRSLPFDISDPVTKGDLLLALDPVDQQREVSKGQAAVAQSEARLHQAEQNLIVAQQGVVTSKAKAKAAVDSAQVKSTQLRAKAERRRALIAEKLGSPEDYEAALMDAAAADADLETANVQVEEARTLEVSVEAKRQEVALAQAQLDSDRVALSDAMQQLQYTRVFAPIDGRVSSRNVQVGTIIASGITNIAGGTTILTLSDLGKIYVVASVDESDIGRVFLGQPATITVDSFPGETFDGKAVRIATKGANVANVVTFEVKIEVTGDNKSKLKPEMTANVSLILDQRRDVLVLPVQAVRRDADQTFVNVIRPDGSRRRRAVELGLDDGDDVQIAHGLSEGEVVELEDSANSRLSRSAKSVFPPPPPGEGL